MLQFLERVSGSWFQVPGSWLVVRGLLSTVYCLMPAPLSSGVRGSRQERSLQRAAGVNDSPFPLVEGGIGEPISIQNLKFLRNLKLITGLDNCLRKDLL